jgi:hypothetical protein
MDESRPCLSKDGVLPVFNITHRRQITEAHASFARAIKLNHRDSGLCTSFALVCLILGDIDSAIVSLHEVLSLSIVLIQALTISPADQIANELMNRALQSNAELSFEMTPDLTPDADTAAIMDDTEHLLQIRRGNIAQEEKKKVTMKKRSSPRIARKLQFSKDVHIEDMDTT